MNRIDRIAAILIQLQSKRVVKGQDIADRFHISLRTVYRDIKTLEEAGVPIHGEPGYGYSIMEGYRLPPVMFSREEATSFLTAEKLMEKFTDPSTFQQFASALFKVKAVLRSDDKDHLDYLNDSIAIVSNPYLPETKKEQNFLQTILQGIGNKVLLTMSYFANHNQRSSTRQVEPIGILMLSNQWYVIAFCRLRNDYRNFKLERIQKLQLSNEHFSKKHPPLKSFLKEIRSADRQLQEVILRFDQSVIRYLGYQKYYCGFVSEKVVGNQIEMTFLTASLDGILRWYMMMPEHVDIVSPSQLKIQARQLLKDGLKRLK